MCVCVKATCSTDGQLRIYEAPDVMNLSQWSLLVSDTCMYNNYYIFVMELLITACSKL